MFRLTLTGFLLSLLIRLIFIYFIIMTNLPSLLEPSSEVVLCRMSGNMGQKNAFTVIFYYCMLQGSDCATLACIKLKFVPKIKHFYAHHLDHKGRTAAQYGPSAN
jgi:hypothetical protein